MTDAFGIPEDDLDPRTALDTVADVIRTRRTSLLMDRDRPVPLEMIAELCGLATWAPNHKKTWPWRFALFTDQGRATLGETMVEDMVAADFGDEGKRLKTAGKYLRSPAVLVVGCVPNENPMLDIENRDSVSAGIQNLLLGATAMGLASFWSTPALTYPPRVLDLCGFDPTDRLVGIIYLGWPDGSTTPPERPQVPITHVTT